MNPHLSRRPRRLTSFLPRLETLERREVPATFVVDSTLDTVANDGVTTLREAIDLANNQAGDDTVTFAASLTAGGPATITLSSALPALSTNIAINGPGANLPTLARAGGAAKFSVFTIPSLAAVSISGLTITGGQANSGGGLFVSGGTLNLTNCAVTNNVVTGSGAGLALASSGAATLVGCTFSGNVAIANGG